ncbi:tat pathway signal sequence [Halenospora varia]|nr:tat pathway signal sequence [Halenospora varia]
MLSSLLSYGLLLAITTNAQDILTLSGGGASSSSNSGSSSSSLTSLTGIIEAATPTGDYLSLTSTITVTTSKSQSSSAISTRAIVSTISSGSTTRTTTVGSTTLFGIGTAIGSNATGTTRQSTTSSQIVLQGSARSSSISLNGTANSTHTATSSSAEPTNTTPCNNYPEFCGRKYGNITEVSAHNSPFVKKGNAAANQALTVTQQLNDGIRLLQGQMHFVNATPHFCHTSCDVLDAGPITDYLGLVKNWVQSHPYDVVTILLGNGGYDKVEKYVPFIEETGLVQYAYTPPKIPMGINDWPTLAEMILGGHRVIFFMDYDANQTSVPWILDEFSQMWETPFDPTNSSFPCTVQRPPDLSEADAKNRLYLVNHNLNYDINLLGNSILVPNIPMLNVTNGVNGSGSLGLNAQNCNASWGYAPKFLNVDYYNVGNGSVFEVAANWNNVTYNRPCCGVASTSGAERTLKTAGRGAMVAAMVVVGLSWMML